MKKNRKRQGSFFTLLVRNYIFFTISLAIIIAMLVGVTFYRVYNVVKEPKVKDLVDYATLLSTEQYGEIPIESLMEKGSYIQVLDDKNKIVYESNSELSPKKFTNGELECIQSYSPYAQIYVEKYYNANKEENTSVTIYYEDDEKNDKIYMVDKNLNLIYTNTNTKIKSFTKKEFDYLTGEYPKDYDVRKYSFHDKDNNDLLLLMYTPTIGEAAYNKINRATIQGIILFIIIYIILITLFIIWMNWKVKKPLSLLHEAILNLKNGKRENYLDYKGPREFYDICESFNEMSKQLYDSEEKRKNLEIDKQKMLADISHDLKTPITVIKGYSKAICDDLVKEEEKNQYLMTIYQKSDTVDELINTFYEYSKMEHPSYELTLEKIDICEYVRVYLAQIYDELYISEVELDVNIPEEIIYCNIDKIQLKRVFENIVSNAIKHNKEGISILFEIKAIEDNVEIIIADSGVGISKEIEKNVFQPFIVGEKSRSKKGSGLGLAVAKKIIEGHKGKISLVSPLENYKTVFEIILPVKK